METNGSCGGNSNAAGSIESVHVEDWDWHEGHAYYRISLKLSPCPTTRVLLRRYSQFSCLQPVVDALLNEYQLDARPHLLTGSGRRRPSLIKTILGSGRGGPEDSGYLDGRCRELDWYLQQIMSCFGGRHKGFWNHPSVVAFFSDAGTDPGATEDVLLIRDSDKECKLNSSFIANWGEWDRNLKQAADLKELLSKQHQRAGCRHQAGEEETITRHYARMRQEYLVLVDELHSVLQRHPSDRGTGDRWSKLEPLVDYRDRADCSTLNHNDHINLHTDSMKDDARGPESSSDARARTADLSNHVRMQEKQLELISESINRLKSMGTQMQSEVDKQNGLAAEITQAVDTSQHRTKAATSRLAKI